MHIRRGSVYMVDLNHYSGSIQGGIRPAVVLQNNVGNKYSPTVIAVPVTSKLNKRRLPTHKVLDGYTRLVDKSTVITEQIVTINKSQIIKYICDVKEEDMIDINNKVAISLALC